MRQLASGRLNRWLPAAVGIAVTTALMLSFGFAHDVGFRRAVLVQRIYFSIYGLVMLASLVMVVAGAERWPVMRRTGKAILIGGVLWGILGFFTPVWLLVCELWWYLGIHSPCL